MKNIEKLIDICINKNIKVNIAESCTGGLICSKIVSQPNASKILNEGIITYSNNSKIYFLNVPNTIIATHGAVSKQTAYYMAKGLSNYKNSDFSVALTGIAGPSGGTLKKPIGLVYFSFCIKNKDIIIHKKLFKGNRNQIREKAANYAIKKSIEILESGI